MIAMLAKNAKRFVYYGLVLITVLTSCNNKHKKHADIDEVKLELRFSRFEEDLFMLRPEVTVSEITSLKKKYGSFIELYANRVIGLHSTGDTAMAAELTGYLNDQYILEVYNEVKSQYGETGWLKKGLEDAFKAYAVYFKGKIIPHALTFTAPFNYNILVTDSILGIGLDMYLGRHYKYYPSTGLPAYKINKFTKEYIITDAMSAWLESDHEADLTKNDLLNNMIHAGKIIYATGMLVPDAADTLLFGYSARQMEWCMQNEENIWKFFISQNLLFNKNPGEFIKFINEGASTSGFPPEAPARLGVFIGWRVINAYLEKHPDMALQELMNVGDGNKILVESGYKPAKS